MAEKIIVFGATGFVGGYIFKLAHEEGYEVYGFSQNGNNNNISPINISNEEEISKIIEEIKPNIVINTAAISNINKAEIERELAYKINVKGAANIAKACRKINCKFIHFSSDTVFKGDAEAYYETDKPAPVNYYGQTKFESEKQVNLIYPESIIIRVSLVLGFPINNASSGLLQIKNRLVNNEKIEVANDEVRSPIDVFTLAECCLELAQLNYKGIIHLASSDSISRYDMTKLYASLAGFDENLIIPIQSKIIPGNALRHKRGVLNINKSKSILTTKQLSVKEYLEKIVIRGLG